MTPEQEKQNNFRRKLKARIDASRTVGKSDDQAVDMLLQFNDLPDGFREQAKQAKASGEAKDFVSALSEHINSSITPDNSGLTNDSFMQKGALGSVSRFLGMEKIGRYAGSKLAMLDPQHRKNLESLTPEEQAMIKSGGVSGKEAIGSAANTALNLAGGTILRGAGAALGIGGRALGLAGGARTLTPALLASKPVATFAKGAALGYASDVASSMNDNESLGQILMPGMGTVLGAGIGAVPGVRNLVKGVGLDGKKAENSFNAVVDTVAPKISGKEGNRLLGSGNVTVDDMGLFKRASANFTKDPETVRIATAVEDIVLPKKSMSANLNLIKDAIRNLSEETVKPFLKDNNVPFNFEDLRVRLTQVQPSGGLKADVSAFNNYNRVREEILDDMATHLRKSGKVENMTDLNELWNARKIVDTRIENELGATAFDSPQYQGVKAAATDIRREINKYITDSLANPGQAEEMNTFYEFLNVARSRGMKITSEQDAYALLRKQMGIKDVPQDVARGAFFRYQLDQMSSMYEAVTNITPKVKGELGMNKLDMLVRGPVARTLGTIGGIAGGVAGVTYLGSQVGGDRQE